jgi:hypothetical protein
MAFPYFDVGRFLEALAQKEIVEELLVLRGENSKLSEVKIDQRSFKYLKKLGVFESFLPSGNKKWLSLTYTEQIVLRISETLWKYGFDIGMIKSVVEVLLSDNWLQEFIRKKLLAKSVSTESILESKAQTPSFLEYCILEKQKHPNLRTITNLDALVISTFNFSKAISIIVNQDGKWAVFAETEDTDVSKLKFQKALFQNSFVNITIKGIFDELVIPNRNKSSILNPNHAGRKNLDALISKGFDFRDIRELEMDNENIYFESNELSPATNIGKAKNQYANQDILIKIRGSKVASIKQLVIKKTNNDV